MLYFALGSVSVFGNWKEEQIRSLETWIIIMARLWVIHLIHVGSGFFSSVVLDYF